MAKKYSGYSTLKKLMELVQSKLNGKVNTADELTDDEVNTLWEEAGMGEISSVDYEARLSEVENDLDNKVDKVDGKQLSTNDFTNELKSKLEEIDLSSPFTYGTEDLVAGESNLETGKVYFVYE